MFFEGTGRVPGVWDADVAEALRVTAAGEGLVRVVVSSGSTTVAVTVPTVALTAGLRAAAPSGGGSR